MNIQRACKVLVKIPSHRDEILPENLRVYNLLTYAVYYAETI